LITVRGSVLLMTASAVCVAGLLAIQHPDWDPLAWFGCLAGLLFAHAANNQLNDFTDHIRGVDRGNYFRLSYGTHVLEDGLLSQRGLLTYFALTGGAAALIGLWLVVRVGSELLWPLLLGSFFLLCYTWPLKQWGLGEPAVLVVWGPLMVGGTFLASTGSWHWEAVAVGLCYALGPTLVIFGKHIDKLPFDREKGVATLPVRMGEKGSRGWVRGMLAVQYAGTIVLMATGSLPWTVSLVFFALPWSRRLWRVFIEAAPRQRPEAFPESIWPLCYAAYAFDHTRWFGSLFLIGLAVGVLVEMPGTIRH
jgi:1,4-dihydroxy-2-naphthoate octaprenyltransferase